MTAVNIERRDPNPAPYSGAERRADAPDADAPDAHQKLLDVQKRLHDGAGRMERIENSIEELKLGQAELKKQLDQNSQATADSAEAIAEVLAIISTAKGFFRGVGVIGSIIKWGLGLATAALAFWFTLKAGRGGNP